MAEDKKTVKKVTQEDELARIMAEDEEMVTIRLFKDSGKYKEDVTVGINGVIWQIQRGKPVEVPRKVAKVLEDVEYQRGVTADLMDGLQKESSI